jgi:hypothetical protein
MKKKDTLTIETTPQYRDTDGNQYLVCVDSNNAVTPYYVGWFAPIGEGESVPDVVEFADIESTNTLDSIAALLREYAETHGLSPVENALMLPPHQLAIQEIEREVDGPELSDLDLLQRIIDSKRECKRLTGLCTRDTTKLVGRLTNRGVTEADIGERHVEIGPKVLNAYDSKTLGSLRNCVDFELLLLVTKEVPSGKQLKAISEHAPPTAKAVIESARRKIETETIVLKIKKPKPHTQARRRRAA